jgi:hypothetical protein
MSNMGQPTAVTKIPFVLGLLIQRSVHTFKKKNCTKECHYSPETLPHADVYNVFILGYPLGDVKVRKKFERNLYMRNTYEK